jgi:hypothetical protein
MSARRHFYQETARLDRFYRVCLYLIDSSGPEAIAQVAKAKQVTITMALTPTIKNNLLLQTKRYLFELVLVRLIACLESFLIESTRGVFNVDKKPFKTKSASLIP